MLLRKVFPIHIALWNGIVRVNTQSSIANLNGQPILKIQKANLTNIFQLTASLAYLSLFVSCITTRPPPEHRKWPSADLTLLIIISFCLQQSKSMLLGAILLNITALAINIKFQIRASLLKIGRTTEVLRKNFKK